MDGKNVDSSVNPSSPAMRAVVEALLVAELAMRTMGWQECVEYEQIGKALANPEVKKLMGETK